MNTIESIHGTSDPNRWVVVTTIGVWVSVWADRENVIITDMAPGPKCSWEGPFGDAVLYVRPDVWNFVRPNPDGGCPLIVKGDKR